MIFTIARRELGALFRSPMAWFIAALMQTAFAWLFLLTLEDYLLAQPQLALQDHSPGITAYMTFRYMAPVSTLFLVVCPLLAMRTFADEFRLQTYALLAAAPISTTALVVGKFLGVWLFTGFLILLTIAMPLSLAPISGIDAATLLLAGTGMLCLTAAATAIGLFFSSLTRHSLTAAICTLATLTFLWLLGKGNFTHPLVKEVMTSLALSTHLGNFFQGILHSRDLLWFVIVTLLFLLLTLLRLDNQRYQPVT
ncbi:MAG: ABC transporter permease [Gammaproteobacteria bacterium]|nr:ABC transporter permease [Gammaproteobacteria bacterium]